VWLDGSGLLEYTTQKGRSILRKRHTPPQLALTKWPSMLPPDFSFSWAEAWDSECSCKESSLIWRLWHQALPVNVWRGKISQAIVKLCPVCDSGQEETNVHCFWTYVHSQEVWCFSNSLFRRCLAQKYPMVSFIPNWRIALFGEAPPFKEQAINCLWFLLRGVTLWVIWVFWNQLVFNHQRWPRAHVTQMIWQGLVEYGRIAWLKCRTAIAKKPATKTKLLKHFDAQWDSFKLLCTRVNMHVTW
jgi:hypothetical protein